MSNMRPKYLNNFLVAFLIVAVVTCGIKFLYKSSSSEVQFLTKDFIKQSPSCEKLNNEFPCINTTLKQGVTFPICTYTAKEDVDISVAFISGGYWDHGRVNSINQQLARFNDAIFIDIGANIGAYTLGVAHAMKRPVISVEPSRETMARLRMSVCLGQLGDRVTLLNGAISDSSNKELHLARHKRNKGITMLSEKTVMNTNHSGVEFISDTIKTSTLDDLLKLTDARKAIMKVDAEGSEITIFNETAASKFFANVDVPMVFMEFVYTNSMYRDNGPKDEKVTQMVEFFYKRNYIATVSHVTKPLPRDWRNWPGNVIFVKET